MFQEHSQGVPGTQIYPSNRQCQQNFEPILADGLNLQFPAQLRRLTKSAPKIRNGIARIVNIQPHSSLHHMDAFAPTPPDWIESAVHAWEFCCPTCRAASTEAQQVWINRRSPVFTDRQGRKWQEFYHCQCGTAWWAWSSDRPPSEFTSEFTPPDPDPTESFWQLDDNFPDVYGSD